MYRAYGLEMWIIPQDCDSKIWAKRETIHLLRHPKIVNFTEAPPDDVIKSFPFVIPLEKKCPPGTSRPKKKAPHFPDDEINGWLQSHIAFL